MPQFTVIIPSHNDYNKAKELSNHLCRLPLAPRNIIIVISSSNPNSDFLEFKLNESNVYETTSLQGRGLQLNQGIHFFYSEIDKQFSTSIETKHYFLFLHADSIQFSHPIFSVIAFVEGISYPVSF